MPLKFKIRPSNLKIFINPVICTKHFEYETYSGLYFVLRCVFRWAKWHQAPLIYTWDTFFFYKEKKSKF